MTLVHVALLGEGTVVWRPAEARHIRDATYELAGVVPDGEKWEFQPGQLVECERQVFSDGSPGLVARRPALPNNSFKPKPLRGSA